MIRRCLESLDLSVWLGNDLEGCGTEHFEHTLWRDDGLAAKVEQNLLSNSGSSLPPPTIDTAFHLETIRVKAVVDCALDDLEEVGKDCEPVVVCQET